jgi:flagellar basal-body rod protein FlgF
MDRIIYTTMTGANAAAQRQAVLANNLANASTTGFRAEMSTFRSVPCRAGAHHPRVCAGGHLRLPGHPGPASHRPCAGRHGHGNAWFAVQGLDGRRPTRATACSRSARRAAGHQQRPARAVRRRRAHRHPARATISLGADGTLTAKMGNQLPVAVGRVKLVTPRRRAAQARR